MGRKETEELFDLVHLLGRRGISCDIFPTSVKPRHLLGFGIGSKCFPTTSQPTADKRKHAVASITLTQKAALSPPQITEIKYFLSKYFWFAKSHSQLSHYASKQTVFSK